MLTRNDFTVNPSLIEEQIIYYRTHLDVFIEDAFPPIKLSRDQHVIARQFGNCSDVKIVQNRGAGKTWLTALCCHAVAVLYPGTKIAVCSATAKQATFVLEKLRDFANTNPNIANELYAGSARSLVQLTSDKGKAMYKNGSTIESYSISTMRGIRAKIVVVDECPDVDQELLDAVVSPTKNYRRENSFNYDFPDYPSKTISITSACTKSNPFYNEFLRVVRQMAKGDKEAFACALDYRAAAANGVNQMEFFESEKLKKPDIVFQMEYGSIFAGASEDSAFPYALTDSCRSLQKVELQQPKNSKSRYIISLDIATSEAKSADNSIISVLKFTERNDGRFQRKLVLMQSFKGQKLDVLAEEIRKLYHLRFPNTEKIIYDARGLGDSLDLFFDKEWLDMTTGREYPPLVVDDKPNMNPMALQILHPFRAVQTLNQRIYTNMRVALEKHTIELPVDSRVMRAAEAEQDSGMPLLTAEEHAIYLETDALLCEMGNIVAKRGASGNVLYDTTSNKHHKDRYSSIAMGNDYISELEKNNLRKYQRGTPCIGLATSF